MLKIKNVQHQHRQIISRPFFVLFFRLSVFLISWCLSHSPTPPVLVFILCLVLMKDRCKLFCRVAGTMVYYQLKDRVIDGTPCGPDTYDICVQGLCRVYLLVYPSSFIWFVKTQQSMRTNFNAVNLSLISYSYDLLNVLISVRSKFRLLQTNFNILSQQILFDMICVYWSGWSLIFQWSVWIL